MAGNVDGGAGASAGDGAVPKVKIMTLGDSAVGKTSLVVRYTDSTFEPDRLSTIGIDFRRKRVNVEGHDIDLQMWDTAGQERFHTITQAYYRGVDAVLLVYDVSNRNSFAHVRKWIGDVEKHNDRFDSVKLLLVANKRDLPPNLHKVSMEEGKGLAAEFGIDLIETSAKTGENVEEAFTCLAHMAASNIIGTQEDDRVELKDPSTGTSDSDSGCCK
mmetsp:Transcript_34613/g.97610  ORF Transcript_34613/g.97610 Transcript_34613/m.97610 type:complete len:216 (+) Transcript_34613:360-1007(+)